jgi:hypothetical protein
VCIVPKSTSGFGYQIQSGERALACSPSSYATPEAAFAAAHRFIDEVDRRMGLGPCDGQA